MKSSVDAILEAARHKSHHCSSDQIHEGGRFGRNSTGKNHTKQLTRRLHVIAIYLRWWLIGGSAVQRPKRHKRLKRPGAADGAPESEQAEKEGVPPAKRVERVAVMWFCGYCNMQHRRHKQRMLKTMTLSEKAGVTSSVACKVASTLLRKHGIDTSISKTTTSSASENGALRLKTAPWWIPRERLDSTPRVETQKEKDVHAISVLFPKEK